MILWLSKGRTALTTHCQEQELSHPFFFSTNASRYTSCFTPLPPCALLEVGSSCVFLGAGGSWGLYSQAFGINYIRQVVRTTRTPLLSTSPVRFNVQLYFTSCIMDRKKLQSVICGLDTSIYNSEPQFLHLKKEVNNSTYQKINVGIIWTMHTKCIAPCLAHRNIQLKIKTVHSCGKKQSWNIKITWMWIIDVNKKDRILRLLEHRRISLWMWAWQRLFR